MDSATGKNGFALMIAKGIPKGKGKPMPKDDPEEASESADDKAGEAAAGTDLADALKGGDGAAIMDALKNAMAYC